MTNVPTERLETGRLISRALGTHEGRAMLAGFGYVSGAPIIACEWDTTISEVMGDLRASAPSVNLAAVAIRKGGELYWMGVTPTKPGDVEDTVSGASTIGMFYQALQAEPWRVRISNMTSARALVPA